MGIARNKQIYTAKFFDGLKAIPGYTFTATLDFWTRANETRHWDRDTNTYEISYVTSNPEPIKARVQPIRSAVQRFTAVDGTWTAHLLISMSYDDRFNISAGSRAKIKSVSNNPSLLNKFLTVKEILDSDNSIEFTILCEVDTEYDEKV